MHVLLGIRMFVSAFQDVVPQSPMERIFHKSESCRWCLPRDFDTDRWRWCPYNLLGVCDYP